MMLAGAVDVCMYAASQFSMRPWKDGHAALPFSSANTQPMIPNGNLLCWLPVASAINLGKSGSRHHGLRQRGGGIDPMQLTDPRACQLHRVVSKRRKTAGT